jgi:hypothetical protein
MAADDPDTIGNIASQIEATAAALAGLPAEQQRRWLLHLLELLDARVAGSDQYLALLSRLATDIRQRISLGQW